MGLTLAVLTVLLIVGVPFAYALIGASLVYFAQAPMGLEMVAQRLSGAIDSYPLAAILLFLLAGSVLARGGIGRRIIDFADLLVGHRRGGLAHVNVMNSLIMGGMSGSGLADVVLDLRVIAPLMQEKGYSKSFASALSIATGVIAPIMPPGILVIIYSIIAGVSVGRMFIASIGPALILAAALFATVFVLAKVGNWAPGRSRRSSSREVARGFRTAILALMMPVILIVGLRFGVFTPTELSAILAGYAIVVSTLLYRGMSVRDLGASARDAIISNSSVMVLIAGGSAFAAVLTLEGIPRRTAALLLSVSESPVIVLLLINLFLLLLGTVMGASAVLVVVTPILVPAAIAVGIDPIHFGTILVVNLLIGALTPPFGIYMLAAKGITGESLTELTRAMLPFYGALIAALMAISYIPQIALFLPSVIMP